MKRPGPFRLLALAVVVVVVVAGCGDDDPIDPGNSTPADGGDSAAGTSGGSGNGGGAGVGGSGGGGGGATGSQGGAFGGGSDGAAGSSGSPDAGVNGACQKDSDCRLFDDYCMGCDCRVLTRTAPDPKCSGPGVSCLKQPCANMAAVCVGGTCMARDVPAGSLRWYFTCGDPVCSGWRDKALPACTVQKAGEACRTAEERCDPKDDCNRLLLCATVDPTAGSGGCPRARPRRSSR